MKKKNFYECYVKRIIDIICSSCALIVLSPVILITGLLVRAKLGSPVLFTQDRPGKGGQVFKLYKFRSMSDARDEDGNLLPDDIRLTKFGRLLRSSSLDELPELINILKGDMTIVGPRPLLVSYLPYYSEHENVRHLVRPGLTGYAQVHGRNSVTWEEKFEMDVHYVQNISFLGDVKIVFDTIFTVLKREGIDLDLEDFDVYRKKQNEMRK